MSTSQLILRITPLTFSSHPLHLSFLLRYHALLSTSLTITSSFADLEIEPFVRPPLPTHYFSLTGSVDVQPSSKIFWTPNSFSILPLPLKTYPATTRHYLISSTFMLTSHANNLWLTSYIQAFAGRLSTHCLPHIRGTGWPSRCWLYSEQYAPIQIMSSGIISFLKNHPAITCVYALTFSLFHPRTLGTLSRALFSEHCYKATAT